jgi:N-acetylmuramoyl-L-alanine amidase
MPGSAQKSQNSSPAPAQVKSGKDVSAIRLGQHPDKTRIVLDVGSDASFTTDLDNAEKILLVELPKTGWSAPTAQRFTNSPLLAGYTAQSMSGGGTRLAIELKRPARVLAASALKAEGDKSARIVLDLAAGG